MIRYARQLVSFSKKPCGSGTGTGLKTSVGGDMPMGDLGDGVDNFIKTFPFWSVGGDGGDARFGGG